MTTALRFTAALLLLLSSACGQPIAQPRTSPLDYAELRGNDGWYLRVHGDGSGTSTVYQSASDLTSRCRSTVGGPLDAAMATAMARMQLAVDDVRSERSCRMLRRAWLASVN